MARGFLSGILWGGIASAGIATVLSQVAEIPPVSTSTPPSAEQEAPRAPDSESLDSESTPALPDVTDETQTPSNSELSEPIGADSEQSLTPDTDSAPVPQTGGDDAGNGLTAPDGATEDAATASPQYDTATPTEQSDAPAAPDVAAVPDVQTEPAELPTPAPDASGGDTEGDTEGGTESEAETEQAEAETNEPAQTPTPEQEPAILPGDDVPDSPGTAAAPNVAQAPAIRMPVPQITDRAPNVTTNRLPRIGIITPESGGQPDQAGASDGIAALDLNSVRFSNPDNKPMYSVLLLDDGSDAVSSDVAGSLPFPVGFALNIALPDAGARAANYRAAGHEVLMSVALPAGAESRDIEVVFESAFGDMPDAVGIIDSSKDGFGSKRLVAKHVIAILAASGHGLLTFDRGLNAAQQIAQRDGVPGLSVFRVIDEGGQDAEAIGRILDRGVFRAQQDGHVVMVGHLNPATIEALTAWALENQNASTVLAPISALLKSVR